MPRVKYLPGHVFDSGAELLERLPDYRGVFRCHCGNEWETVISQVVRGGSCGCSRGGNYTYLPGHVFDSGAELLERRGERGKKPRGLFRCHCGNEWEAQIRKVVRGDSCGCARVGNYTYLPGHVFDSGIELLERRGARGTSYRGWFRCHCGNEWETVISHIAVGQASCGCALGRNYAYHPGHVFDSGIELLERLPDYRGVFRCHCGNEWETQIGGVAMGQASCGCIDGRAYGGTRCRSSWEAVLVASLEKAGLAFEYEPQKFDTPPWHVYP